MQAVVAEAPVISYCQSISYCFSSCCRLLFLTERWLWEQSSKCVTLPYPCKMITYFRQRGDNRSYHRKTEQDWRIRALGHKKESAIVSLVSSPLNLMQSPCTSLCSFQSGGGLADTYKISCCTQAWVKCCQF